MYKNEVTSGMESILSALPEKIREAAEKLKKRGRISELNEIRLRESGYQSFVLCGDEFAVTCSGDIEKMPREPLLLDTKELENTVFRLCCGSVYSHSSELEKGYISCCGIRVGVCGKALIKDGKMCGFSEYRSLNIRFPRHAADAADELFGYIEKVGSDTVGGILVISPPCGGKTTFLRALASKFASGYYDKGVFCTKRVCVIDEREELYLPEAFKTGFADILSAFPKAEGVELCTRVMSPDYIICDEIGNAADADAICSCATKGVTFAASCHGVGAADVMKKSGMKRLFNEGVFSTVCELNVTGRKRRCTLRNASEIGEMIC